MKLTPVALVPNPGDYDPFVPVLERHEDDAHHSRWDVVNSYLNEKDLQKQTKLNNEYCAELAGIATQVCIDVKGEMTRQTGKYSPVMPAAVAIRGITGVIMHESTARLQVVDDIYNKQTSAPRKKYDADRSYYRGGPIDAVLNNATDTGNLIVAQRDYVPGTVEAAIRQALGEQDSLEYATGKIMNLLVWQHILVEQRILRETIQARQQFQGDHPFKARLQRYGFGK